MASREILARNELVAVMILEAFGRKREAKIDFCFKTKFFTIISEFMNLESL